MTDKERKARGAALTARLKEIYPDAECALEYHGDPYRLLVMAILSAQCTDKRVNTVSEGLFTAYPDVYAMAAAPVEGIEERIRSCGLYHSKAKNIRSASEKLIRDFHGGVPSGMDELLSLPGVGRKIANLLRGDVFHLPAVVTDTHCIRLSGRLGLCPAGEKNPYKIEKLLVRAIEPEEQSDFCHRLVWFGRDVCRAQNPACENCPLADLCAAKAKK